MSKRVLTTKNNHGENCYREWGRMGYEVTLARYFNGDREAMNNWLARMGQYSQDCHTSYHKPEIFGHPGVHPAWIIEQREWLDHAERNITGLFADKNE